MLQITHKVNLVIYLIDNITGYSVETPMKLALEPEHKAQVIHKSNGTHAVLGLPEGEINLKLQVHGYEETEIKAFITEEPFPTEVTVFLSPNEFYMENIAYKTISGVHKGIKYLEAVRYNSEFCRYKELDERKRIITIYNQKGKEFKETPYAIIHESGTYERLKIIKRISSEKIKVQDIPEKAYQVGDKINRICFGRVDEDGNYEIKLADEGNEKYLVKYADEGGEYFKLLDFKAMESFEL